MLPGKFVFFGKDGINTTFVCRYHIGQTNTVSHARPEINEKKCWRGVPIVFFSLHARLTFACSAGPAKLINMQTFLRTVHSGKKRRDRHEKNIALLLLLWHRRLSPPPSTGFGGGVTVFLLLNCSGRRRRRRRRRRCSMTLRLSPLFFISVYYFSVPLEF